MSCHLDNSQLCSSILGCFKHCRHISIHFQQFLAIFSKFLVTTAIFIHCQLSPAIPCHFGQFQTSLAISSIFLTFTAIPAHSISSHLNPFWLYQPFKPVPAISWGFKSLEAFLSNPITCCYTQICSAICMHSSNFKLFHAISSHSSISSNFQEMLANFSYVLSFRQFPAIFIHFQHIQPLSVVSSTLDVFQST